MTVTFVTNFCPHYRVRTFELLAERLDAEFLFFSGGGEWYWSAHRGIRRGTFPHRYLKGFTVAGTRITPSLPWHLALRDDQAIIKCINGRFALPVTYLMARLRRRPFVLWTGVWHRLGTRAHRWLYPLTRYIYRHADAVVVYGEHVRRFLIGEGVEPARIFVAPHATDAELYGRSPSAAELEAAKRRLDVPPNRPLVLYLGRLETDKGVHDLVTAFLLRPPGNAVLWLVGSGSEQPVLEQRIREARAEDRVRILPPIPPEEVPLYQALATLFVLVSITTPTSKETWGLVVNEAFYQGTPVIASDAVGAAAGGLVEHEVTGWVVPEGDREALSDALHRLVGDERLRQRLGEAGRERVAAWTNEAMVQGFADAVAFARKRRKSSR